jgi:hypothetical protein
MALQLTENGRDTFLDALQARIRYAMLVDADGDEIRGWNYTEKQIQPDGWDGTQYEDGVTWIFVTTDPGNEAAQIVAGLAWADAERQVLAIEPLDEPFIVNRTGQTLVVEPTLRLFGVVGRQRED